MLDKELKGVPFILNFLAEFSGAKRRATNKSEIKINH